MESSKTHITGISSIKDGQPSTMATDCYKLAMQNKTAFFFPIRKKANNMLLVAQQPVKQGSIK